MYALYAPDLGDFTFYLTKSEVRKLLEGEKLSCELVTKRGKEYLIESTISFEIKEDQSEPTYIDTITLHNREKEVGTYYLSRKFVKESLSNDLKLTVSYGLISLQRDNFLEKFWIGTYSEAISTRGDLSSSHAKAKNLLIAHRP